MLRKALIAVALLASSAGAMAHDDFIYGRVVTVEPHFVLSFSSGHYQDGFRVLYEVGGHRYWTHHHRHPGHVIWVPRPVGYYAYPHRHHHWGGHRDWDDRRHSWHHRDHDGHHDRD